MFRSSSRRWLLLAASALTLLAAAPAQARVLDVTKRHVGFSHFTTIQSAVKNVNGIEVFKANNVWIENLTVRNFDRNRRDGDNGNEIWWNGGDGSCRIGARGWYGQ